MLAKRNLQLRHWPGSRSKGPCSNVKFHTHGGIFWNLLSKTTPETQILYTFMPTRANPLLDFHEIHRFYHMTQQCYRSLGVVIMSVHESHVYCDKTEVLSLLVFRYQQWLAGDAPST